MSGAADRELQGIDRLLEREAPPGYLEEAERAVAAPARVEETGRVSAALFRLGDERFLLDAALVREVHPPARVHRLPGRTNDVFLGIVSLRGEIHLAADLRALLGVETSAEGRAASPRTVVVARGAERWAFPADEVSGILRYEPKALASPQVTVAKASVRFTDAVLPLPDGVAARLDPERLFVALARSLG